MSGIFSSSLGKKLIMSISGLFLMLFLVVHLTTNLLLLIGDGELYNKAAHFLASTPALKVVEYLLAFGFFFHIVYATIITLKNRKARPVGYTKASSNDLTTWSSKNMYILGFTILAFLVLHLINFFLKIRTGQVPDISYDGGITHIHNSYQLVSEFFISYWWYNVIYIFSAILLGLHLSHGFWSAFQTIGLNNSKWMVRLQYATYIYSVIMAIGFTIIPLFFWFVK
ncbi:MAG TPA: succinate dehydrogenase cytochrome b subunit [Tenuifilaceae bacterium]|nr:succinate dehydrogenase cytochrome b subunit [Tenuifilaceae bacterium]HPE19191.1 succinate dehydrogenase cytochrome b subunit [Tenuifilaceae bacterium]HPJ45738.1 succinate dehydrogenase cytochrome b subunit [Tenuifilaceae bacterium]HPQ33701.1 succinate dehydrogenase cytochrome b subunit [Tenuifilaceae bacterium]HRX68877.1 succinate dehydrogenase cytochrome b subunit [Tenuifilaceae bacterium]